MMMFRTILLSGVLLVSALGTGARAEAPATALPLFPEVYNLVSSNLTGAGQADLNRAAVLGFIAQLQPQVSLLTNAAEAGPSSGPLLSKATVIDGAYAVLRIGRVGPDLSKEVAASYNQMKATNKLKGLVIDLRFATGQDYQAAGETADLFFDTDRPLLEWGEQAFRSRSKSNAVDLPFVVLINGGTAGSAEALAAALSLAEGALTIGSPSAGAAYLFKDFPLSGGQVLRVANGWVARGDGKKLTDKGLVPDIRVAVSAEEERGFFDDPYKPLPRPLVQSSRTNGSEIAAGATNSRARRRPNEADLVRMQRDGVDLNTELAITGGAGTTIATVTDPVLARALDLLKGLSLALKRR